MSVWRALTEKALSAWMARFRVRHRLMPPTMPTILLRQAGEKLLLHVGCGHARREHTVPGFQGPEWREIRLDADVTVAPDLLATMTDMPMVPDGGVDAVFSSHGIEHLYWHEVPRAFYEFRRVLADDGILVLTCPDLQSAARMIAEDRVFDTAYVSAAGDITPFDIVYSFRPFVAANPRWMAHHCGFTLTTLLAALRDAGFVAYCGMRRESAFDLWVLACKQPRSEEQLKALALAFLPAEE